MKFVKSNSMKSSRRRDSHIEKDRLGGNSWRALVCLAVDLTGRSDLGIESEIE